MTNTQMDKYAAGFGLSLIVTSLLNAAILLIKETNDGIIKAMKAAMGHHWTTHGVIIIVVFVLLGFIFSYMKLETKWDSQRMLKYIIWAVIISGAVCAGFYLPDLKMAGGKTPY
jgi:hypothetical protein